MTATGFDLISTKKDQLIRKTLKGGVWIAPYSATALTMANLFDPTSGDVVALPAGYGELGELEVAGPTFTPSIKVSDIMSLGSNDPSRSDIVSDITTMGVVAQETNLRTVGLYTGADSAGIAAGNNGVFSIQPPPVPTTRYYRVLSVSADETDSGEFIIARFFPRAMVSNRDKQSYDYGTAETQWGVTFTAHKDSVLGYAQDFLFGGAAALALASDMSVPRTITATIATTTALVVTGGKLFPSDAGKTLSAPGKITPGTTLQTYTDATHGVMSAVGLAAGTGVVVTIS